MSFEFPNIRHLRALSEVARHKGISAAADAVFLSQPAITQAITKLELRLGLVMFDRLPSGMSVTEPGAMFVERVDRTLAHLRIGFEEASRLDVGKNGKSRAQADRLVTAAQLRALTALSEAQSFTVAARNIGISQPSIHRAGRGLENLVGYALFDTTSQGIELTKPAEILARHIRLAASEMQQAFYEIEAYKGRDSTLIVIGSLPLARTRILPRAMHIMQQQKKGVQLRTIEGPYSELLRSLRYGESDFLIGALRDPVPNDDVEQFPLFDDLLAIVVRSGHPLCDLPKPSLKDTLAYPWIAPPKETPAGSYLSAVLGIPEMEKTPVKVVSSSLILVRGMLLEGDYVTIISHHQVRHELENGTLVTLPIALPDSARAIGLTVRKGWKPTLTQEVFLNIVKATATEMGQS
ncbi:MAG: LysR family transcriptional regulator [Rhodobacteraceae bacterium]|nr:LysR family transcriptional regulator [Paracoccaceae bacterium]